MIGLETKHSNTQLGDEITNLCLLKEDLINPKQYYGIIKEWVYPGISGLKIEWKASKNDSTRGILVITIPSQNRVMKPFLIKKVIDKRKTSEILFGYAERKTGESEPLKIQDIHSILRNGMLYTENIEKRFDALEAKLPSQKRQGTEEVTENQVNIKHLISSRREEILAENDMRTRRALILVAYPSGQPSELKTLFSNKPGSVKRSLENPPITRHGGWTLETRDIGKIIKGELVRVSTLRKTVDLYKDGTLMLVGDVESLLCHWQSGNIIKINPLAMIELVYNFLLFYNEVIMDLSDKPSNVHLEFGFINMWLDGTKNYIIPGRHDAFAQLDELEKFPAPEAEHFSKPIDCTLKKFDIGNATYEIIRQIYLWFGIAPEGTNIPYTKTVGTTASIDIEQIKKI